MAARIGINGFGRIGRMVLRRSLKKDKIQCGSNDPVIVAINDPYMSAEQIACRFKHDSTHGMFDGEVSVVGTALTVDGGQLIEISNEKDPAKIPWKRGCAEYVVEATGLFTSAERASCHIHDGIKRVLITAISNDAPNFVFGVNHECYTNDMKVIAMASCTTNCLAPLAKVVHENFGIEGGLMCTVHALTSAQNVLDGPATKDFRKGRGAVQNIVPLMSGASQALGLVYPPLDKKIVGTAVRVPVANGSLLDLNLKICKDASYEVIKCRIKDAAATYMKGILAYTEEKIVSSDVIGDSRSTIFDASAGMSQSKNFVKLVAWYDNEWSTACRVLDLLKYMSSREACSSA